MMSTLDVTRDGDVEIRDAQASHCRAVCLARA